MKRRLICVCAALVLLSAGATIGAGNYQRTKDGKVTVWNDDPEPGDAATWFGGHDGEGYASGIGTLIWYTGDGAVYARYHGTMVRGKFDGTVKVDSRGKTARAVFADGKRTTRWIPGAAATGTLALTRAGAAAENRSEGHAAGKSEMTRAQTTKPSLAESPRPIASTPEKQSVAKKETTERRTARAESTKPKAERPKEDIPAEGPVSAQKAPTETTPPKLTETSLPPPAGAELNAQAPIPEATQPTLTIQDKPEVGDFSPPSALRGNSPSDSAPADIGPDIASSPPASAQLTAQEATALADAEAQAHGYDLGAYQRPKADYSAVKGQWSFFYNSKDAGVAPGNPSHLDVSVDDTTKKAEVKQ